jgi:hypothetical protein
MTPVVGVDRLVFFFVLHSQTPGGMVGARRGTTLRARLNDDLVRVLQRSGFLETPMPSLFHA